MLDQILDFVFGFFEYGILFYCLGILLSYVVISLISAKMVKAYTKRKAILDHS